MLRYFLFNIFIRYIFRTLYIIYLFNHVEYFRKVEIYFGETVCIIFFFAYAVRTDHHGYIRIVSLC